MRLERIKLEGYKSIRQMELELRPLNILVGANGAGKSNLISLFRLLNEIREKKLQSYTAKARIDSLLYYGRKTTDQIHIELIFPGDEPQLSNGYELTLEPSQEQTLVITHEECWFWDKREHPQRPLQEIIGKGHKESRLSEAVGEANFPGVIRRIISYLQNWQLYYFHFQDTGETARVKQKQNISDNRRLLPDAANLATILYRFQEAEPNTYNKILETIRLAAPFFDDFSLEPDYFNPDQIELLWRERGNDLIFNAYDLSDGTLRFIALTTLLLQPELPSVILVDEPELGLHPYAISLLAEMLEAAATQTQIIVSTQSVPLVNQFSPEDIIVVDRKDGQSTFERLQSEPLEHWLVDYGLGDLWEKNLIGGRPLR